MLQRLKLLSVLRQITVSRRNKLIFISSFLILGSKLAHALDPTRILVVYNLDYTDDQDGDGVQDSSEVANYYSIKRGVPAANILGIHVGAGTEYTTENFASQSAFYTAMVSPIESYLTSVGTETIDTILICYGVPYYIANNTSVDSAISELWQVTSSAVPACYVALNSIGGYSAAGPTFETDRPNFTHAGTMMTDCTTFLPGPPFPYDMYLVSRLDGPNGVLGALGLVDEGRWGDVYISSQTGGYSGNIYVNTSNEQTLSYLQSQTDVQEGLFQNYGDVTNNINMTVYYPNALDFPIKWNPIAGPSGNLLPFAGTFTDGSTTEAAPKAMMYVGWYGQLPSTFTFLDGMVYCDFNSFSLQGFREGQYIPYDTQVAALAQGATGVTGTINEPETTGHPRPNVLVYYLLKGYSWAEASNLSTQQTGWMQVNIGDPMYTPFDPAKSFVQDTSSPTLEAGYPIISTTTTSATFTVTVNDSPEPEVIHLQINYGPTFSYGSSVISGAPYWRINQLSLIGLTNNTQYHYQLVMTDPEGNQTVTPDETFNLGNPIIPSNINNAVITNGTIH
jgi:hypothetical protein